MFPLSAEQEGTVSGERRLPLAGARNFRDLGGYPIRGGELAWGQVYRSDRLTDLTDDDVAALLQRGLRTVIDLRTSAEASRYGPGRLSGHVERLHLSLLTPQLALRPTLAYADWAAAAVEPLSILFDRMVGDTDPFPLVFHCSVGKDRTGIVAALLLSALGAPREVIVDDYALTRQYFDPTSQGIGKWRRRVLRHFPGVPQDRARQLLDAAPETMDSFLDELSQRFGSIEGFLDSVGLRAPERARLQQRLGGQ
jgi:protein-tyrosine phosphatase